MNLTNTQKTIFATITWMSSFAFVFLQIVPPVNLIVLISSFLIFGLSFYLLLLLEMEDEYGWAGPALFLGKLVFVTLAYGMLFKSLCDGQPPFGP